MSALDITPEKVKTLVRVHRLYETMRESSHLLGDIRQGFQNKLLENKLADQQAFRGDARENLQRTGAGVTEEDIADYSNALMDLTIADYFSQEEIERVVNMARKREIRHKLIRLVNSEGEPPAHIRTALKEYCSIGSIAPPITGSETESLRVALIRRFISNQLKFIGVAKQYLTVFDIGEIVDRALWNPRQPGKIGGKAAGMTLANKILQTSIADEDPELAGSLAVPNSYFFSSGFFTDFLDYNDLHHCHDLKYRSPEEIEEQYESLARSFQKASFPDDVVEMFRGFLREVGEGPLVLRSSSLLEDNFDHAFSGKYESVFITNKGDPESRLQELLDGLKCVYCSTFSPAALLYRKDRDLIDVDERMSVLAQTVIGREYGDYFFPTAAGVAYSFNIFNWTDRIKQEDGLARLVLGLGTRAVSAAADDYPRLVALSHPFLRPEIEAPQIARYSQKMADVLNLKRKEVQSLPIVDLLCSIDHPHMFYFASILKDGDLVCPIYKTQPIDPRQSLITFDNFLSKTPFSSLMKKVLSALREGYGRQINIEFVWEDEKLYIIQCRSLPSLLGQDETVVAPPNVSRDRVLFENRGNMSNAQLSDIEYIVYVDPKAYARIESFDDKVAVGRAIGKINRILGNKRFALFGPGRWGSADINLGVRVNYADINNTLILGEIAFGDGDMEPQVSYGTHFFNDLVEARIVPLAIYPGKTGVVFNEAFFSSQTNMLSALAPECAPHEKVIRLIHVAGTTGGKLLHVYQDGRHQRGIGFLAAKDEDFTSLCAGHE